MEQEYFTSVPVPKAIAKFAVPTIFSQMVTLAYNLADTFFVGHTGDPNQVAALTLSFPIFMSLTAIGNLMGVGANSLISRSLGSGDEKRAKYAGAFGLYGAICLTAILSVGLLLGMRPILTMVGASQDTYSYTSSYLMWTVVIGGIPTVCSLVLGHLIRAEGNSKQASIGMSLGGIINMVLDPLLIFCGSFGNYRCSSGYGCFQSDFDGVLSGGVIPKAWEYCNLPAPKVSPWPKRCLFADSFGGISGGSGCDTGQLRKYRPDPLYGPLWGFECGCIWCRAENRHHNHTDYHRHHSGNHAADRI